MLLQPNFCYDNLLPQTFCNSVQTKFFIAMGVYCNNFEFIITKNFVAIGLFLVVLVVET